MNRWGTIAGSVGMVVAAVVLLASAALPPKSSSESVPEAIVAQADKPSCPYVDGRASSDSEERRRKKARVAAFTGQGLALHKNVFGVTLGQSDRGSLDVWAAARGMTCLSRQGSHDIECKAASPHVVATQFAGAEDLTVFAGFDAKKKLTQLKFVASFSDFSKAAEALRHTWKETEAFAGRPSHVTGEPEAHFLSTNLWQQARAEFRRQDLYAKVSATNLGNYVALMHHIEDLSSDLL